jgi:hypothetical protein
MEGGDKEKVSDTKACEIFVNKDVIQRLSFLGCVEVTSNLALAFLYLSIAWLSSLAWGNYICNCS